MTRPRNFPLSLWERVGVRACGLDLPPSFHHRALTPTLSQREREQYRNTP
jgi:hypothetical protein